MSKKHIHRFYTRLKAVSLWSLVLGFVIFGAIAIVSLRANNQRMLDLRAAVFQTDKDNGDVEKALRDLRAYVYGHMNTNLASGSNPVKPPVQLKYTYERLVASEKQRVADVTSQLYVDAQVSCEARYQGALTGTTRLNCIKDYVDARPVLTSTPPDALYKFDFQSPFWSPDLAGWSLVLCIVFGALLAIRLIGGLFIHSQLRKHH